MSLNRVPARYLRVMLGAALFLTVLPQDASAWWDLTWQRRRKIFIQNGTIPSTLTNFPVLVRLTDPAQIDYTRTQAAGQDLRFVDSTDSIQLNHEIERWNEGGVSWVWVKIPSIPASSNAQFFYMYYGKPTAPAMPLAWAQGTWDAQYMMVHHLEETAAAHQDSTNKAHDSNFINVAAPGQGQKAGFVAGTVDGAASGGADQFRNTHRIDVPDHNDLDIANNESFTVEAWIKTGWTGNFQEIVAKDWNMPVGAATGWDFMIWSGDQLRFSVYDDTPALNSTAQGGTVAGNGWHYVVGTWDNASSTARIFIDGAPVASNTQAGLAGSAFGGPNVLKIGEEADNNSGFNFGGTLAGQEGQIDEVRISKAVLGSPRSADWINAQNRSMTDVYLIFDVATAVELQSFSATGREAAVELSWTTASELNNMGFHVYRAESEGGPYTRITSSLIPGLGSSATGQSYSYADSGLQNGRTYFYKLEDVETTGKTELHGPVSATPVAGVSAGSSGGSTPRGSGSPGTTHGNPQGVVLREVERSSKHVVLELLTPGFYASPVEDGRVRLSIPGFESLSRPGELSLPARRALVEAVAGKKIRLASVVPSDVLRFPGLRPMVEGVPEIEVSEDGSVLPSRRAVRARRSLRSVFPGESARLGGSVFQGETKKAELLLFPLRFDGRTGQLELSRRLLVRLEFAATEGKERSLGGTRGRKAPERRRRSGGVVAQFLVKERGLYRVSYEEVFPLPGSARGLSSGSLRLSRQGENVAFHVAPDRRTFGPGSWLYLLSEGEKLNPYGDAVYELETNQTGLLMAVETLSSSSSGVVTEHFQTLEREENKYYQSGLLDAPDLWQWDVVVSPGTKSYPFTVEHLSLSSSAARLTVDLQGASDFDGVVDHHVRVGVNGSVVGEGSWDGKLPRTLELEVGAGLLREGENTLEIEDVGDTGADYSMVFLNRFSLSYPRRLLATGGRLEGRFETSGQAVVEGLSTSSVLLDTTGVPRWLRGLQDTASGVRFPVQAGRSYLATSVELHPTVRVLGTSSLKSTTNRADYLLLGPREFLPAAQPLLDRRSSEGLVTKAVSLEEIYEQFGHGEVSPEAIKEFLEYAYQSWASPSPRYVLLLGDASYDPKDYLKTGVLNRLPGFPTRTSFLWTVSDPAYASVNGEDLIPDLAIGRLPAASLAEAQALVQKVLAFENGGGNFQGRAVLVADNADLAGNFEQDADEIATGILASRSPQKIYYSQLGGPTRAAIRDAFDQGASFVSYVGHGGTVIWASENIFNFQDVATLLPQPQQPLLLTMNCLNGFFHFPPLNSLSEAFLKAEGKGAIGAFSPSGLSINEAAHLYHKALLEEILSGRHERMGDAVLAAQEAYAQTGAFPELLSIYHLFGDPALGIR